MNSIDHITKQEIRKLQKNLQVIRKMANWTTADLAEKLGITDQTVRNIERNDPDKPMSKIQYIAIRAVIDYEIETNKDNEVLKKVVDVLLNSEDCEDVKDEKELIANYAIGAKDTGLSDDIILSVIDSIIHTSNSLEKLIFFSAEAIVSIPKWLSKIIK